MILGGLLPDSEPEEEKLEDAPKLDQDVSLELLIEDVDKRWKLKAAA